MKKLLCAYLFLTVITQGVSFAQGEKAFGSEYRLAVNDLIEISVYQEPDLSKTVRVAPDGTITYPLLGNVAVGGLTARELEERIKTLLEKDYMVNPQVNVFIKEYAKVFISGQIARPGAYEMKSGLTLTGAVALAGGFTDKADLKKVKINRLQEGEKNTLIIDTTQIDNLPGEGKDTVLLPNDTIVAEDLGMVSVTGQVRLPGRYNLKRDMTVMDAIAVAGGITEKGDYSNVRLIRAQGSTEEEPIVIDVSDINVSPGEGKDMILFPNDSVIVEEFGRISVLGQVKAPGYYSLKKEMSVVDAIALAGGLTELASGNATKVIRMEDGRKQIITVPLEAILQGKEKSRDIFLEPGDTIFVPESFF